MNINHKENAKLFKALGDENRLAILVMLLEGEKCACELLDELKITQPTLSHHMKILCDAEIVESCKDGKWMHYSICVDRSRYLKQVLSIYTLTSEKEKNYKKCDFKNKECEKISSLK